MAVKIRLARTAGKKWPSTAWSWRIRRCPRRALHRVRRTYAPGESGEDRDRRGGDLKWLAKARCDRNGQEPSEKVRRMEKVPGVQGEQTRHGLKFLDVGRVVGLHGVRGKVKVAAFSGTLRDPGREEAAALRGTRDGARGGRDYEVATAQRAGGCAVFSFRGSTLSRRRTVGEGGRLHAS